MSSIGEVYARFRKLIHEGSKFLIIGAFGFIVTLGAANALHPIGKYKAITIATILATVVTYLGNRYWTFRHRQSQGTARDSTLFFVMNGIGLLIYYGCIGLTDLAGLTGKLWYNVAIIVGTILGTLFRFWSYRKWIWLETPVLEFSEPIEERAQDLAAMVGGGPIRHGSARGAARNPASSSATSARATSARATSANAASANGASANGASANGAPQVSPHSHARPGRATFRHVQSDGDQRADGHVPASHRRTP